MHIIIPVVFKRSVIVDEERILNKGLYGCVYVCVCVCVCVKKVVSNVPNFDCESSYSSYFWIKRFLESCITRAIFAFFYFRADRTDVGCG